MATFTEVLPPQASSPHNAAHWQPTGDGRGVLTIDTAHCRCRYLVAELPVPEARTRAFRLVKLAPGTGAESDVYTAGVGPRPADRFRECRGFLYGKGRFAGQIAVFAEGTDMDLGDWSPAALAAIVSEEAEALTAGDPADTPTLATKE